MLQRRSDEFSSSPRMDLRGRRSFTHRMPRKLFLVAVGLPLFSLLAMLSLNQKLRRSASIVHGIRANQVSSSLTRIGVDCMTSDAGCTNQPPGRHRGSNSDQGLPERVDIPVGVKSLSLAKLPETAEPVGREGDHRNGEPAVELDRVSNALGDEEPKVESGSVPDHPPIQETTGRAERPSGAGSSDNERLHESDRGAAGDGHVDTPHISDGSNNVPDEVGTGERDESIPISRPDEGDATSADSSKMVESRETIGGEDQHTIRVDETAGIANPESTAGVLGDIQTRNEESPLSGSPPDANEEAGLTGRTESRNVAELTVSQEIVELNDRVNIADVEQAKSSPENVEADRKDDPVPDSPPASHPEGVASLEEAKRIPESDKTGGEDESLNTLNLQPDNDAHGETVHVSRSVVEAAEQASPREGVESPDTVDHPRDDEHVGGEGPTRIAEPEQPNNAPVDDQTSDKAEAEQPEIIHGNDRSANEKIHPTSEKGQVPEAADHQANGGVSDAVEPQSRFEPQGSLEKTTGDRTDDRKDDSPLNTETLENQGTNGEAEVASKSINNENALGQVDSNRSNDPTNTNSNDSDKYIATNKTVSLPPREGATGKSNHSRYHDSQSQDSKKAKLSDGDGLAIPEDFESLPYPYFHRQLPNAYLHPSNGSIYRSATAAFVHSPKSAGTTIKNCMFSTLRDRGTKPVLLSFKTAAGIRQDLLNDRTVMDRYYMGDSTLGICDYGPPRPCTYFTIMREPYERVVSHYYFCKDGGVSYPPCDNSTIEEFVLDSCSLFFRQTTVQFNCAEVEEDECAGYPGCPSSWACNATEVHPDNLPVTPAQRRSILQYVTDRLDRMFAVIGLAEEFDASLELFQDTFGIKFYDKCKGVHENRGEYLHRENVIGETNKTREKEIEAAKRRLRQNEAVRQCLSEDEQIYNRAKEIFQLQKERFREKMNKRKTS